MDRPRYDSAMFWLAFGTASAVIGLALMTIGVTLSSPGDSFLASPWFDGGLVLLGLGVLLLLLALWLFLTRRRAVTQAGGGSATPAENAEAEAVRGYYRERQKLIDIYEKQQRNRRSKS